MSVLNNLAMRSQKFKGHPPSYIHRHSKHCKVHSRTWPREKSISPSKVELGIQGVSALRSRPHSAEKCSHCNDSDVESLYKSMQKYTNTEKIYDNVYLAYIAKENLRYGNLNQVFGIIE